VQELEAVGGGAYLDELVAAELAASAEKKAGKQ
jgi:hypothetical protein